MKEQQYVGSTGLNGVVLGNFYDGRGFFQKIWGVGEREEKPGMMIQIHNPGAPYLLRRVPIIVEDFRRAGYPMPGTEVTLDLMVTLDRQGYVSHRATNVAQLKAA